MINKAKWIGGGDLLRRTFCIDGDLQSADLYITGLGYYVCYVNGARVGDVETAPSYTFYEKRVEYNRFDVKKLLKQGKNTLAIMLGGHWPKNTEQLCFKPYYKGENMACCVLDLGDEVIISDEKFKANSSPIVDSGIYDGEIFDATLEPIGWKLPEFDDKDWSSAIIMENKARLVESYLPPIRIVKRLSPVKKWRGKDGLIFDFGVNISGKLTIKGTFRKGARIVMRHAECVYPNTQELNTGSLRIARATDEYVARDGEQSYTPYFTYHGFRYAEITCSDEECLNSIEVIANEVHTDAKRVCEIETDNDQLNKIFAMMQQTFLNNMYSIPTDCHQRDERQGWLGDAQLSCESILHCFDAVDFYKKYLDDIADAISEDGNVCSFTAPPLYMGDSLMWSGAYYMIVEALFRLFDDRETVKKHYSNLLNYYRFLEKKEIDGFPNISGFGDWLCIASTDECQIRDAVYIDFTAKMGVFAQVVGEVGLADELKAKTERLKKAYNEKYYSPHESTNRNSGYYGACAGISQLGNALPICYGIPEDKDFPRIAEKLVYDIKFARGRLHPTTGLVGTKYLFEALEKIGRDDIILELLLKKDYPSLGFMLENGATTAWERWEFMTDNEMNSHCHTPLVAPCKWLITRLAGLTYPKYKDGEFVFSVNPYFAEDINYVKASLQTKAGKISVQIQKSGLKRALNVVFPADCAVEIQGKTYRGGQIEVLI